MAADTLSVEALGAEARKLPGTWVDSFFQERYMRLVLKREGPAIASAMAVYEKIRPKDEAAGAFIHLGRGAAHQVGGRHDSAEIHYKSAQDWWEQHNGAKVYLQHLLVHRAGNFQMQSKYDEAVTMKYKALELLDNEKDRATQKVSIANFFVAIGEPDKALDLLGGVVQVLEESRDTITLAIAVSTEGIALLKKNEYAKSLECFQRTLSLRRSIGQKNLFQETLQNIAVSLGKLGQWQAALDTLKSAEKLDATFKQGQTRVQLATGDALFHLNRLPEADLYLLPCLENSRTRKQYQIAFEAATLLSMSKKQQGKPAEALDFLTQRIAFKDSLFSKEKEKIIQETATKYETREKQAEIAALKLEKHLTNQRNGWIATFLFSLGGAIAWFVRYRHRREKAMLEKDIATKRLENEVLEKGLETKRLENEVLLANENLNRQNLENAAREIGLHKTQLEEFMALMVEKNTKIEALQSKIEQASLPGESNPLRKNTPNDDDIEALFQTSLLTETDWQRFQKHFEKVFPGILNRLKIQFPELSTAELRLVLLSKMGLKSKETANLLGISPDSVRKLKYRFKKKMGLSEEELLEKVGAPIEEKTGAGRRAEL